MVLVLNPVLAETKSTAQGYPLDFFERLDAIKSDDLVEGP